MILGKSTVLKIPWLLLCGYSLRFMKPIKHSNKWGLRKTVQTSNDNIDMEIDMFVDIVNIQKIIWGYRYQELSTWILLNCLSTIFLSTT